MSDNTLTDCFKLLAEGNRLYMTESHQLEDDSLSDRQRMINAQVEQQMLYEKWLKQDSWLLRSQAVPLLIGCEPEQWSGFCEIDNNSSLEQNLWRLIKDSISSTGSPVVDDFSIEESDWQVSVRNIYGWARTQQIAVPSAFDNLMSFMMSAVKIEVPEVSAVNLGSIPSAGDADDREKVLGAALAMLTAVPEQCREDDGWISGERMAKQISSKALILFPDAPPKMSVKDMAILIDKWTAIMEEGEASPF